MTRRSWLWLAVSLTCAALVATFVIPIRRDALTTAMKPAATPFGWDAQLSLSAGDGVLGLRDGQALQARFADPYGVAVGADGSVYVADAGDNNRIRRIGRDGMVSTLAGSAEGFVDGAGVAARFDTPSGLALDRAGNLYVADTGNHAIRKVSPQGVVTTVAGTGVGGFRDGPGAQAQFSGPIGVAVDTAGRIFVADTYNDRIRMIQPDGQVSTLAGGEFPGYQDGVGSAARFDTPTALAVDADGVIWIADTRNNAIRRLTPAGEVTTLRTIPQDLYAMRRPISLALTRDGFLYVGEMASGRVLQLSRGGAWHVLTGNTQGERMARPAGLALDADGMLHVADAGSYRVYRTAPRDTHVEPMPVAMGPSEHNLLPDTGGRWPLRPQLGWHEVVGTLGEVRGNYDGESRDHLHGGLDIRGDAGAQVLAIADAKVSSPSGAWGLGELGEGIALDTISYIHMRVGRTAKGEMIDPGRFHLLHDEAGKPERMRVLRGTRFKVGDVLGTINGMAHVHLSVGANGYERNAVALGFTQYADAQPPRVDSIRLFDAMAQPLTQKQRGRVLVPRDALGVQIIVDAWDQVDRNLPRRRLGLHAVGYQVLHSDGSPLPGFEAPLMNIQFNRMPADSEAVKIAYGPDSGITVHGSAITRFQYVVTNTVRDGTLLTGYWQPGELPAGDYTVRITARDYSGNVASTGRDLPLTLQ
ncbi:NHL repeat-containing protein [Lysobacter cavernae]|uniref:NHL repeat-containing protein n=1 Tax=Lysobacter cavernae TaxID=1685901 RepID=A0ABV7RQN8_9GAMM